MYKLTPFWALVILATLVIVGRSFLMERVNLIESENNSIEPLKEAFRFSKLPITYSIEMQANLDDEYEVARIRKAFEMIEEQTEKAVSFKEVSPYENADIKVMGLMPPENERFRIEGLAGPTELTPSKEISKASVELFPGYYAYYNVDREYFFDEYYIYESKEYNLVEGLSWTRMSCGNFSSTETHEILHALGFGHVYNDDRNVMAPIKLNIKSCKNEQIDERTINCLKGIYSQPQNLSFCEEIDLYPWEEEPTRDDFKWDSLPVTYSLVNCSNQEASNLRKAEKRIEGVIGHNLFQFVQPGEALVLFYCGISFGDVVLNEEVDFWDSGVYFPAAQPIYTFSDDQIKNVSIYLFADKKVCKGIEFHELLHALGFRGGDHTSVWFAQETDVCASSQILDELLIEEIKKRYSLY